MGKKSKGKQQALALLASEDLPILELKYSEPLFQLVCHPEKNLILSGLSNGYIYCHTYDAGKLIEILKDNEKMSKKSKKEQKKDAKFWTVIDVIKESPDDESQEESPVKLLWKTKRHKGSVRAMCIDDDGKYFYSIGTDNVLKKSETDTGKVIKKCVFPSQDSKFTKMVKSPTHNFIIIGDETGSIHVLDSNELELKNKLTKVHNSDDAINDIFQFAKRSVHKYISLGQTTLAYWDCRESNESDSKLDPEDKESKRKVYLSDDQEDEIICGTFVDPEVGDTVVCGMGEGIVTIWKPIRNDLEDQMSRVKIAKDESIDCLIPTLQDDNCVWCGCSDGNIYKIDVKKGKVVEIRKHSSIDEVNFLDLDSEYRVVSGGMDSVKIWNLSNDDDEDNSSEENSFSDISDSDDAEGNSSDESDDEDIWDELEDNKNKDDSDDDEQDSSSDNDTLGMSREELIAELDKDIFGSDEDEADEESNDNQKKRKNKKEHQDSNKKLKKKLTPKQAKQLQKMHSKEHGIMKFDDL